MGSDDVRALLGRLVRLARLDATAFLEVRDEPAATIPAILVVVVASLLSGLGGWLYYLSKIPSVICDSSCFFINSVLYGSLFEIVMWFAWVSIVWLMLQQIWRRHIEFWPLARTMGLAYFPVALSVLFIVRPLATPIGVISLAASVMLSGVAVEATLAASADAEPAEILLSNLAGFSCFAVVLGLLGRVQFYAPGLFAFSI